VAAADADVPIGGSQPWLTTCGRGRSKIAADYLADRHEVGGFHTYNHMRRLLAVEIESALRDVQREVIEAAAKQRETAMSDAEQLVAKLTYGEKLLLEWLSKAERSQYGECRGRDLTVLINMGLAKPDVWPCSDLDWVALTPLGMSVLAAIRALLPPTTPVD